MGRHREGWRVRKTSIGWQCPKAQEAIQWTGTKRAKPETEIKKQLPGKEEVRRLETQQLSSLKALPRSPQQ